MLLGPNLDGDRISFHIGPNDEVVTGVRFGRSDELLSPAYWVMRCSNIDMADCNFVSQHASLEEEVGFCLLGGYGVTLEIADAFFKKLRENGVFDHRASVPEEDILQLLETPTAVHGRPHRYRFPKQRARRLHLAMQNVAKMEVDVSDPLNFRDQIQLIKGVGPKTASWITRNWLDTDKVAILDIHVLRAGWAINLFDKNCRLPKDYFDLERRFIMFAEKLHLRASILDAVIWTDMRKFGSKLVRDSNSAKF